MSTGSRRRKSNPSKQGDRVKQKFPDKLWSVVCDDNEDSCTWTDSGESILINKGKFTAKFLSNSSRLFRTSNFKSFVRQLNLYGFRKVNKMRRRDYEIWWEYRNEYFIRGRSDLLAKIKRKASVDDIDDIAEPSRPIRRRRDPKRITNVFNLRLAQFDPEDEESNDDDHDLVRQQTIDLVPSKSQSSDLILDFLEKNSHVSAKQDYLLSFMGEDSCYEIFSDHEIEDSTKEVESIIARMDALEGENQVKDYSMRGLTKQVSEDKDENNKENKSQEKTGTVEKMDFCSQEEERAFSDESFVINIPLSQKQILDGSDSFITVSLFPDLPPPQNYNPMLGTNSDSEDVIYETKSHLSFTPTYPLSPSL